MNSYIIRRLLLIIPTLLLISLIIFFMVRLIPGDVMQLMLTQGGGYYTDVTYEELRHALGLDMPIYVQYGRWLGFLPYPNAGFKGLLQGNLGSSLWTNRPVTEELIKGLPISFELGVIAVITALLIALPVGIYSAIRQDTVGDYVARSFAISCIALPSFWLGTMVLIFPAIWWHWSPPMAYVSLFKDPVTNLKMFIIPGIILGMVLSGITMRMTRTMMLEVLRQDYIRTAWAKGLREKTVIFRHALKNALIPVITIVGLQLPVIIGGSVVLEKIFSLPGLGRLVFEVIHSRDYTMLSGINMFMATIVLFINLIVDITYAYLDPRIRYA